MSILTIDAVIAEGPRRHRRTTAVYRQATMRRMPTADRVDAADANGRWTDRDLRALRILAGVR
jgi:hypothetical protein